MVVGLVAGSLRPSRGLMSNLYFSDTVLHLRVRNISHALIQYIWCAGSLLLDWLRLGHILGRDTWRYALDSDVCHPPLEGAGVVCGPVVDVAVLWSS